MYRVHGFNLSFNAWKVLYVAEELGVEYEYVALDPTKGEHKSPAHLARHPNGKIPTLEHDGRTLFESGAICRYLAAYEGSSLYPADDVYGRAVADQWMDFFTCHAGRWIGTLLFERVFREQFGMGPKNEVVEAEAVGYLEQQLPAVDAALAAAPYLAGQALTIADPFAYAYVETCAASAFALDPYPNIVRWAANYGEREAVARVKAKLAGA